MKNKKLNITWCYPDILNLHGDRGNIMAFERIGNLLNVDVVVKRVSDYNDKIDFNKTDILFFNVGEIKVLHKIINSLKNQIEELKKYIDDNKTIIVIGTTVGVFANELIRLDGTKIEGLGFLDLVCTEKKEVYGNDLIFSLKENSDLKVNGSQIQLIDININNAEPYGVLEYGYGNCGDGKAEGARYKNLIFTNALGPVFVKNPWLTEKVIKDVFKVKKQRIIKSINPKEFEIELKSMECIRNFIKQK